MPRKPALLLSLLNLVLKPIAGQTSAPSNQLAVLPHHPLPADREAWRVHWQAQDQPWRTEPEIDIKRQRYLATRRVISPDIKQGIYPFKDIKLSRADVEWLLATHEYGRGPVDWSDEGQRERKGLDLRGADLRGVDLQNLPMARMCGGQQPEALGLTQKQYQEQYEAATVHLEGANLYAAHLEGADLFGAHLEDAKLNYTHLEKAQLVWGRLERADFHGSIGPPDTGAHLEGANLYAAHLEGANLYAAHLEGAALDSAHLEGADCRGAHLETAMLVNAHLEGAALNSAHLEGAHLMIAFLDHSTELDYVTFANKKYGAAYLYRVHWGGTDLSVVNWPHLRMLGDEIKARQKVYDGKKKWKQMRIVEHEWAVRANRQLAIALQEQGLNEDAARYAYHAQILQRKIHWIQRDFGKWFFSMLLALVAGYGYRMWRILAAYVIVVSLCAVAYFIIGIYHAPHLSLLQAFLESVTAFHGRVFYELFIPDTLQIWVTAFEAVVGLLIEGVFIAMLTQRFFGK